MPLSFSHLPSLFHRNFIPSNLVAAAFQSVSQAPLPPTLSDDVGLHDNAMATFWIGLHRKQMQLATEVRNSTDELGSLKPKFFNLSINVHHTLRGRLHLWPFWNDLDHNYVRLKVSWLRNMSELIGEHFMMTHRLEYDLWPWLSSWHSKIIINCPIFTDWIKYIAICR